MLWRALKEGLNLKTRDLCRVPASKRGERHVRSENLTTPLSENHTKRLILEEHFKLFVRFIGGCTESMDLVHTVHNHHHAADFAGQRAPRPRRPTKPLHRATYAGEEIEIGGERLAGERASMEFAPPLGNLGENLIMTFPKDRCHIELVLRAPRWTRGDVAHLCINHGDRSRRECDLLCQGTLNRTRRIDDVRCTKCFESRWICDGHFSPMAAPDVFGDARWNLRCVQHKSQGVTHGDFAPT